MKGHWHGIVVRLSLAPVLAQDQHVQHGAAAPAAAASTALINGQVMKVD
jgi:hypothetical protein